jgi:Holliday junction resolvase
MAKKTTKPAPKTKPVAKAKKKINSRAKGASGERELAAYLVECGIPARRGQQFAGGGDSPDVVADLPGLHLEVKRVEALRLWPAIDQAQRDAPIGATPVIVHRASRRPWVAIVTLDDFLDLYRRANPPTADGLYEVEEHDPQAIQRAAQSFDEAMGVEDRPPPPYTTDDPPLDNYRRAADVNEGKPVEPLISSSPEDREPPTDHRNFDPPPPDAEDDPWR